MYVNRKTLASLATAFGILAGVIFGPFFGMIFSSFVLDMFPIDEHIKEFQGISIILSVVSCSFIFAKAFKYLSRE